MQHLTQFCPPSAASSPALARLLPINPSKSPTARTVKALRRKRILEFISFGSPFNAPCGCRMLFHLAGSLSTALDRETALDCSIGIRKKAGLEIRIQDCTRLPMVSAIWSGRALERGTAGARLLVGDAPLGGFSYTLES